MALPIPILGSIVSGITGFFTKKQDLKKAKVSAKAKLDHARLNGEHTLEMTDAEWESLAVKQDSWKDEYITVIITSPFVTILSGSIAAALGYEWGPKVVQGTQDGLAAMVDLGMDYGVLIMAVTFAAVGLKLWRA